MEVIHSTLLSLRSGVHQKAARNEMIPDRFESMARIVGKQHHRHNHI
jgi:hypothetical protein